MDVIIQQIVNGLVVGAVYSLIGLGFTMVYGVLRIVNFAHGATYMEWWDPALKDKGGASLYGSMIRRINMVGGKIKGSTTRASSINFSRQCVTASQYAKGNPANNKITVVNAASCRLSQIASKSMAITRGFQSRNAAI